MDPSLIHQHEVLLGVTRSQRNAALDAAAQSHAADVIGFQGRIEDLEGQLDGARETIADLREQLARAREELNGYVDQAIRDRALELVENEPPSKPFWPVKGADGGDDQT